MKRILLKLKPFQETIGAGACGPASLKIVLGYYGVEKSEKELAKLAKTDKKWGTSDKNLVKVARHFGFKTIVKDYCNFKDIEKWLKGGVPPIVDWMTRGRMDYSDVNVPDGHYSPICGLDDKYVYLQDPELGKIRKLARGDFWQVWFDFPGGTITRRNIIIRRIIVVYK
jgi:ABC-type bacteriocin/lantibiotic exporter with double-glycine peptidase domain